MTKGREKTRCVRSVPAAFKTRSAEDGPVIEGYFAVFNSSYEIWRGATEQIAPGAFASSLGVYDIRALVDHESRLVLGRTGAGTLSLREDEHGLWGEIKINEQDADAMSLYARVQRGDVNQCSFGFEIINEEYIEYPDGSCRWILKDVRLYEVSVVTFPAYEETSVVARKADYQNIKKRRAQAWRNKMKVRLTQCSE